MARSVRAWLLTWTVLALATGCAATQEDPKTVERVVRREGTPKMIVDVATGKTLEPHEFYEAIRVKRIVYVAERHDNAYDHAAQNAIVRALHKADSSLAIGFEMFDASAQPALDRWRMGELDENTLRRETDYDNRWGFDFAFYRPMLELARSSGLRVIGLNAPREVTRAVAKGGLDALSDEQRAQLPELILDDAGHRAQFDRNFEHAAHANNDPASLNRYYAAQVIWDETMASRVAAAARMDGAARRMVVLAGRMHLQSGLGVPNRAKRRGAGSHAIIFPVSQSELREFMRAAKHRPAADYFWVIND